MLEQAVEEDCSTAADNPTAEADSYSRATNNLPNFRITEEIKTIQPRTEYLGGAELIRYRHVDTSQPQIGTKRTKAEGSVEEAKELSTIYAKLRAKFNVRRIDRLGKRTLAIWNEEEGAVEVVRRYGKFEHFGYNTAGKLFLYYYEALFLLELGRLELRHHGMLSSIEQAYALLLGESASSKFNKYFVYSSLSRAGIICSNHQSNPSVDFSFCNWTILKCSLTQTPIPPFVKESPIFDEVRAQTERAKSLIAGEGSGRQVETEPPYKKLKHSPALSQTEYARGGLLNCLTRDPQHQLPSHIFKRCNVVRLRSTAEILQASENIRPLEVSFDLHLHNNGFRRSDPPTPAFYIVIINPDDKFPTHDEVVACMQQQANPFVPLLLVSVSESKQLQAFSYYNS